MKEEFRVVVVAAIHDENKRFLLARRHPKDDNLPDFWSTPAGHVEANEHDTDVLRGDSGIDWFFGSVTGPMDFILDRSRTEPLN